MCVSDLSDNPYLTDKDIHCLIISIYSPTPYSMASIAEQPVVWPQLENFDIDKKRPKVACKYVLSKHCLGNGSFSRVYECKHVDTHSHFAVKLIKKKSNRGKIKLIQNEFKILSKISNSSINNNNNNNYNYNNNTGNSTNISTGNDESKKYLLKLYDYFETDQDFYLITDLAVGGDLFDKILNDGCYKVESDGIKIINSIVSGLYFLKKQNIIHRDLKAENIFFKYSNTKFDVLIGDFGLSTYANSEKLREHSGNGSNQDNDDDLSNMLCGTLSYMAPEILDRKSYSFPIDIWALGVLIYFMFCGYMPFDCETDDETKEAIKTSDYMFEPPEYWDHVSANMRQTISKCFILQQDERITIEQMQNDEYLKRSGKSSSGAAKAFSHLNESNRNNSNTDLKRFDSPIIEDSESTTEEELLTTSASSDSLSDEEDEEREKALNSLRESLYGSLKSADSGSGGNINDRNSNNNNNHKNDLHHTLNNHAGDHHHSVGNSNSPQKPSKAAFVLSGSSLLASQKSFSYTSLRDLNKRTLSNSSLKDLFNLNLRSNNNSNSQTNVQFTKMNGALCVEPETSATFRAASSRSNITSRINSTFNSINPSRINSRNHSRVNSNVHSRVQSRTHSKIFSNKIHSRTNSLS